MKTIVAGDSFSNGFELKPRSEWWRIAFTDAKCVAKNGDSNEECFRKILASFETVDNIVVMWTFPSRVSFYPGIHLDPHRNYSNTVHNQFRNLYYSLTSDHNYVHLTWLNILALQSLCEAHGKNYAFTTATHELFRINDTTYTRDITRLPINWDRFFTINNSTMGLIEFSHVNNYAISSTGHPLETAHRDYGQQFKEWYDARA